MTKLFIKTINELQIKKMDFWITGNSFFSEAKQQFCVNVLSADK